MDEGRETFALSTRLLSILYLPLNDTNMKRIYLFLTGLFLSVGMWAAERGALILHSPQDYQVYAISPNGEWACGVYVNLNNMGYGFRWNLLTGETELLSGDLCLSEGTSISNDGVVVGMFDDTEATDNGAPAYTAGYWKDGKWHHLPNINNASVNNNDQVGYAYAITADGTYIGGSYNDKNSRLIPIVWKDGEIAHTFPQEKGCEGMIYTISADGNKAAGWSITPNSDKARVATIWDKEKGATIIMDERYSNAWCSSRKFSPSGKYLLFWEGWVDLPFNGSNTSGMGLRALYNVETGEKTDVPTLTRDPWNFDVFDVNDNGTIVGYESPERTQLDQAIIFKDGKTYWLYNYLKELGVDLDSDKNILREGNDIYFIRGVGITNDEKTFAVLYYDRQGALCSMIIKLDEDLTTREPVQLETTHLAGTTAVRLSWEKPLAGAEGVTGYNVYCNGVKVNTQPVTETTYIDDAKSYAEHTYHVTALYGEVESKASLTAVAKMENVTEQAPRNLFARQMGYANALLQWDLPRTNLTVKSFYTEGATVTGFGGGNNSFEAAICFPAEEMALYAGSLIQSVSFYPMSPQTSWRVNIYKKVAGGARELVYTQLVEQTLSYGKENVVKLTTPVACPADADLYVAIEVNVPADYAEYNVIGEVNGDPIPGQTDLLRMTIEPEFYSLYEEGKKFGATQLTTWAIAANLSASDAKVDQIDVVDHYVVYAGANEVGQTTDLAYSLNALTEGEHTLGVKTVYADGRSSALATMPLAIVPNENVYKAITDVKIARPTANSVIFKWEAPVDNDETFLTHCTDELQGGVLGPSENNYNYIAATVYTPAKTKGYEGYRVKAFKFFPITTAEYTFFLEEDGKVICEAWPEAYTPGLWSTVELSKEVTIKAGSTYRLLLDCYDVAPGTAPLGLDARLPYVEESDLYSLNEGVTYSSVSQASAFGNWMMGLVLVNPVEKAIPVEGYNVRVNKAQVNTELLTEPTMECQFPEGDATYKLNVDVCYTADRIVEGNTIFFEVGPKSIGEQTVAMLHIEQQQSFLRVSGVEVSEVSLVNISGQTVARSNDSQLHIGNLAAGTYVLRIVTAQGVQSQKVQIVK